MTASDLSSGKGHRDENFPVASWILAARHRAPVMAFYRFARTADDVADHPSASPARKLADLATMRQGLAGVPGSPEAVALGAVMAARGLSTAHANDLLDAFVQDVRVSRYASWDDLIAYCRLSAMPVGRFVLDVHGESRLTWPANDALCAALQVINHLQDCGDDFRERDRVYIPTDTLDRHGAHPDDLGRPRASPALLAAVRETAERTRALLATSRAFAPQIVDRRLRAEVRVIQALAEDLTERLLCRDPLSQSVHHGKARAAWLALRALVRR
jgi:squalene synthase HpnC